MSAISADDEVVIFFQKRQTGRPGRRELDVGLVHDHDVVGVRLQHLLDGVHRGQQAGGRVRVGNDNRIVQAAVFFRVDGQVSLQRDDVLRELERHIYRYTELNTDKRFKSLEILELMR